MHLQSFDPSVMINTNVSNQNQLCTQQSLLENYHFVYFKYSGNIYFLFKEGSTSALLQLLI